MTVKEKMRKDDYVLQTKRMLKRGMLTLLEAVSSVNERWSNGLMTLEEAARHWTMGIRKLQPRKDRVL